tara:strand:- start:476 stop:1243 length:768 start_codon:yes stop_codon:yes gene_type:complete
MRKTSFHNVPATLICGHGSRSPEAAAEFTSLLKNLQKARPDLPLAGAYLEFNSPTIPEGLQAFYDQGHRTIHVQPLTLYNAGHTKADIPDILSTFKDQNPDVILKYGSALGLTDQMIAVAAASVESVLPEGDRENCKLLVVGRGSKDRAVADQTITLCRKLHDRFDFGDSRYCYAADSAPLLDSALTQAARSHYPEVVVLPYLLFSGRLRRDIQTAITAAAAKYPDFTFHMAPHLGIQDALADAILAKIDVIGQF